MAGNWLSPPSLPLMTMVLGRRMTCRCVVGLAQRDSNQVACKEWSQSIFCRRSLGPFTAQRRIGAEKDAEAALMLCRVASKLVVVESWGDEVLMRHMLIHSQ
ncbi:hypothetical protein HPB47_023191 [Ixodes persulcatus]|uniref:Uncharacterized protein n=1 Tax=Ixodes persulcatus TaxID=34615 RepID=A0AC60Q7K6_IXOPE|nr:hypothetical protein HPB47_023191 [Ixodes persulcatus]